MKDKSYYLRFQSQQKLQTWWKSGKRLIGIKLLGSKSEVREVFEDDDMLVDVEESLDERGTLLASRGASTEGGDDNEHGEVFNSEILVLNTNGQVRVEHEIGESSVPLPDPIKSSTE